MTENSTTAGTTLLASELNGFDGMYRSTKLNGGRRSTSVVLKNMALSTVGKRQRNQEREERARGPEPDQHRAGPHAERPRLRVGQRSEARHDRERDVRQHRHLQQLHEAVGGPLQDARVLAEKQPDGDACRQADQNSA